MKWIAAGALRQLLGTMMLLGLGGRRGTRLNRLRLWIWAMVVSVVGTGVLASCDKDKNEPITCYDPAVDTSTDPGEEDSS
jgi:hypothetical protein